MPKDIQVLATLAWEQMTREERVALMIADYPSYANKVPKEHWLMILDGLARAGGISE